MTARTKTERLKRLVSHGYFAPELPPCFVSDDLAKFRRAVLSGIDALPPVKNAPAFYRYISEPAWFYFPRFGKDDRRHGVPNPIAHLLLARVIADHYVDLRRKARASRITLSPPVFDWNGSRALMRPSVDLRDNFRVNLSSRREDYLAADVRAFFHSIYTHAIPWAIYGKTWAKQNRGVIHYGNLIDLLCRNAQDGQTIGLPVGPDTSRMLAEAVASAMDAQLQTKLNIGKQDASRYIDDYTISSASGDRGETLLAALRQAAAAFELELNNDKTAVHLTSHRQSTGWQQAVRNYIPQRPFTDSDLQHFFYQLGRLCAVHNDINVEKFGIQNARSAIVNATDWRAIQPILISAYRRNPSVVSLLVEACLLRQAARADVELLDLREFIENRISVLAHADRSGEVIWLLFLAIRLNLVLSARALAPLFDIENSFIALLVSCLDSKFLVNGGIDRTVWNRSLDSDGLRGKMWLYAYEATTQGFIPRVNDDFITQDSYFALLREKRIQFLAIDRGYVSMAATLRALREDNDRMRRLRNAMRAASEELDDFDDDEDLEDFDVELNDDGY